MNAEGMTNQDSQIIEFLAGGMPAIEVAALVGVSLELITTNLSDSTFRTLVKDRGAELRVERVEQKYARTEENILKKIDDYAQTEFCEIPALVRALEVIAKNRVLYRNPAGLGAPAGNQQVNNFVTLLLPEKAKMADHVTLNAQGEIIAVGDRNMASMPLDGVREIFHTIEIQNQEKANAKSTNQSAATASA